MLVALQAILLSLIGCSILFYAAAAMAVYCFFTARRQPCTTTPQPVSVLVPVCGVDEGARENWESFCAQEHEAYEVLFGVMSPDDPSVPILKEVVAQFPGRAKLFCGLPPLGINHQISNLIHLLAVAQHDIVVLADSDMRVGPTYLRHVTAPLADPSIGVVTCGYLDQRPRSLGAALAALGRGVEFIPSVLIARYLDHGLRFALGPTIATRRSVLAAIGGLQALLQRIGSDYHIGSRAAIAGYRVELSPYLLQNDCGSESIWDVVRRELRWARTIRLNRGPQYYGLGITYGTVYSLLLWLISAGQAWTLLLCLGTLAVRFAQALLTIHRLHCPALFHWLWVLPLRDLTSFLIWLGGAFGHRVYWRGRYLAVGTQGVLMEIAPSPWEGGAPQARSKIQFWQQRGTLTRALKALFIGP
jgi:ceramide glucosyltransferase